MLNKDVSAKDLPHVQSFPLSITALGKWIKALRKEKGLTLVNLSELTGYSHPYLSQIETGKRDSYPSPELLKKLASHLDVEYYELLGAAGYTDLAQGVKFNKAVEDFSNWDEKYTVEEMERLRQENAAWNHVTDIKAFLEEDFVMYDIEDKKSVTPLSPSYNGHTLTADDRERMLKMMEILFPQYQKPWNPKGKH